MSPMDRTCNVFFNRWRKVAKRRAADFALKVNVDAILRYVGLTSCIVF